MINIVHTLTILLMDVIIINCHVNEREFGGGWGQRVTLPIKLVERL